MHRSVFMISSDTHHNPIGSSGESRAPCTDVQITAQKWQDFQVNVAFLEP